MSFKKLKINSKQMDRHTDWLTHRQTDGCKKETKSKNTNTVNAGPPDTEYLYYPLDVGGVTLKSSCLPVNSFQRKLSTNGGILSLL